MAYLRPDELELLHDSSEDEALLFDGIPDSDDDTPGPTQHPVRSMQGPFDESLIDSLDQIENGKSRLKFSTLSAAERRERLLDDEEYNDTYNAKWRGNPDWTYHPLAKVVSQIAFGMHLLHKRLAASDEEVIRILQKHIDEVDEFVGRADEDLDMALVDIGERINHLKIPLEHIDTFEVMLEDREYRLQTLEGNDNIERIVQKTAILMDDILSDLKQGLQALQDLSDYFLSIGSTWPKDTTSMGLYNAMLANTEGWIDWFDGLQKKGNMVGASLVQLGTFLNEIAKRAGIASRRQALNSNPNSARQSPNMPFTRSISSNLITTSKPLPQDPDSLARALQETMPKARTSRTPQVDELTKSEKAKNRQSTWTIKSQAISDKRSSTQTIASAFHPSREKVEKSRKKSDKAEKTSKAARMKQMKQMIPSMPKIPRPRRVSTSEKFSFSMGRTKSPTSNRESVKTASVSSIDAMTRPKPTTQPSYDTIREGTPAQHTRSPHISIEPAPASTNLDQTKSPHLSDSSTASQQPALARRPVPLTSIAHRPNASKSSNADSLIPLSPISMISSRPASPVSSLSARADSPPLSQQPMALPSRERPRMVDLKKVGHSNTSSLGGDLPTPMLPSTRFDPNALSAASSRTASPIPAAIPERKTESRRVSHALSLDLSSPDGPKTLSPTLTQRQQTESPDLAQPLGLATPPIDDSKTENNGLYQQRRIEIRRVGQVSGIDTPPPTDPIKTESPILGVSTTRPDSWASWASSRSSSSNPKIRARVAHILQQSASQVASPETTPETVNGSKEDEVKRSDPSPQGAAPVLEVKIFPPPLGLNIQAEIPDSPQLQDFPKTPISATAPITLFSERRSTSPIEVEEKPVQVPEITTEEVSDKPVQEVTKAVIGEETEDISKANSLPTISDDLYKATNGVPKSSNVLKSKKEGVNDDSPKIVLSATITDVSEDLSSFFFSNPFKDFSVGALNDFTAEAPQKSSVHMTKSGLVNAVVSDSDEATQSQSVKTPESESVTTTESQSIQIIAATATSALDKSPATLSKIDITERPFKDTVDLPKAEGVDASKNSVVDILKNSPVETLKNSPVNTPVLDSKRSSTSNVSVMNFPEPGKIEPFVLPRTGMKITRKPVPKPSISTLNSIDKSPILPSPSPSPTPDHEGSPKKSPIGKSQLRRIGSDGLSPGNLAPPQFKSSDRTSFRPSPPPKDINIVSPLKLSPLNMDLLRSPYPPDSAYASSMTDLRRAHSPDMRPSTAKSMKGSAFRANTKLALFPTPSPSIYAARSEVSLPLHNDDSPKSKDEYGIGEEAESALPMAVPTLRHRKNTTSTNPGGSGKMTASINSIKKLMAFGRRRTVDVGPDG